MQQFRAPAIAELAGQLLRGPVRLRLRQLLNIEFLLSIIELDKGYPADFVCHVLTGFRPRAGQPGPRDGALIDGDVLTGDLVLLAEHLSEDARLSRQDWDGRIYSISELAQRFAVSTKTIFRWRRRGLIGWKFRFPDHRVRVAFVDRCVRRFVAQNTGLVHRGSSFSQLTQAERQQIIERAKALFEEGFTTVNAVAKRMAGDTGRAVETIRLILKGYDEAHPGAGVFNRSKLDVALDDQQLAIWEAYQDGAALEALAARFGEPVPWIYATVTRMRARELKTRKLEYIFSSEFEAPGTDEAILSHPDALAPYKTDPAAARRIPADLPPYLRQLFLIPLLTREGELALFRKMNFLKWEVDRRRQALDPDSVTAVELDRVEDLLGQADQVKNQITQSNLRLVVSMAKRHVGSGLDFFEIISDGNVSLMRAVEKFDFTRGFKFSTYASWAIMRNYARMIPEQRYQRDRYQTGHDEWLENIAEPQFDEHDEEQTRALRGALERMLGTLDQRERSILRQRFGLDDGGEPQTLEQIGRRLGVSKERIRQLESRAISKLRSDFEVDAPRWLGS